LLLLLLVVLLLLLLLLDCLGSMRTEISCGPQGEKLA